MAPKPRVSFLKKMVAGCVDLLTPLPLLGVVLLGLTRCTTPPPVPEKSLGGPESPSFQEVSWSELPGWRSEDFQGVAEALDRTCRSGGVAKFLKEAHDVRLGTQAEWRQVCGEYRHHRRQDLRSFFEQHFKPLKMGVTPTPQAGLFTGYYEPELRGSLTPGGPYLYPLYKRPQDLIVIEDLGIFHPDFKGRRVSGRLKGGTLVPYDDRKAITKWKPQADQVLAWVDSQVDAFFLEIQGSGRILLPDGTVMYVGYDGQNGHAYVPIGRVLKERGELDPKNISMQSIRRWISEHPHQAQDLMHMNPSYVFFKKSKATKGAMGVPLTGGRSLAVDRSYYPLGIPMWLDAEHPLEPGQRIQRLVMAQDTGGAIKGILRGDVFWGAGPQAALWAGMMKSTGDLYVLVPRLTKGTSVG